MMGYCEPSGYCTLPVLVKWGVRRLLHQWSQTSGTVQLRTMYLFELEILDWFIFYTYIYCVSTIGTDPDLRPVPGWGPRLLAVCLTPSLLTGHCTCWITSIAISQQAYIFAACQPDTLNDTIPRALPNTAEHPARCTCILVMMLVVISMPRWRPRLSSLIWVVSPSQKHSLKSQPTK